MSENIKKSLELIDFIKEKLASDLYQAQLKNLFNVNEEELKKVIKFAKLSIDNNFSKSVESIFREQ
jgi:uncharacterized Fe-S cluster-containing radical SAM superfamily enzyme